MSTLLEELSAIKTAEDKIVGNKVANFAYDDYAYAQNDANGVDTYNVNNHQNIPNASANILKVNATILTKGWRAQASAITRMLMNHFLGRCSYNLNKVNDLFSLLLTKFMAFLGSSNGIATLDENGRIPYSQLPESAIELKGYWNADTNTPALVDGTGDNGDEYIVSVAGTQDLGSGSQYFGVGDRVIYTSGIWKNNSSGFVRTVNNTSPDAQGDIKAVLGSATFPVTKSFLGAVFGRLLGKHWYARGNYDFSSFAYANGLWYQMDRGYSMEYSEDLKTWHSVSISGASALPTDIYYANGLWFGTSSGTYGMVWSDDGKTFTKCTGINTLVSALIYANGLWVCASYKGMWWSEDGKAWTQGTGLSNSYVMRTVVYANGLWVSGSSDIYGEAHGVWWSEDGKAWTQGTGLNASYSVEIVRYANGLWLCGHVSRNSPGYGLWWSTDGKAWTQCTGLDTSYGVLQLVYANGLWVCSTVTPPDTYHGMWWSEDGKAWTQCTGVSTTEQVNDLNYANGLWVCGASSRGAWWSEDGKAWTQGTGTSALYVHNAGYANGLWVLIAQRGGAWWSENGKVWTLCKETDTDTFVSNLMYAKGIWLYTDLAVGNRIWYSSIDDLIADGAISLGADIPLVNA